MIFPLYSTHKSPRDGQQTLGWFPPDVPNILSCPNKCTVLKRRDTTQSSCACYMTLCILPVPYVLQVRCQAHFVTVSLLLNASCLRDTLSLKYTPLFILFWSVLRDNMFFVWGRWDDVSENVDDNGLERHILIQLQWITAFIQLGEGEIKQFRQSLCPRLLFFRCCLNWISSATHLVHKLEEWFWKKVILINSARLRSRNCCRISTINQPYGTTRIWKDNYKNLFHFNH